MSQGNGKDKISLLSAIASSGDTSVKLATLALVCLSGVGNFFATKQGNGATRVEVDRVLAQMDKILEYEASDSERNQRNAELIAELKANQSWMLRWLNKKNLPPDSWATPNE